MARKRYIVPALALTLALTALTGCGETAAVPAARDAEAASVVELAPDNGLMLDLGALTDTGVPLSAEPAFNFYLTPTASGTLTKENDSTVIDYSNTADGYVMIRWIGEKDAKVKALVKGPSATAYYYDLRTDGTYETFPFSDGSGSYTVAVYKNVEGTKYSTVLSLTADVALKDEFGVFLYPNQYVNYSAANAAVKLAEELCEGLEDNLAKVEAVYSYVVTNITYDKEKAATVQSGYLPDIDETLRTGKGICFDYASLMAAMLRSQGVPVKLVVGYTGSAYHAWISVWSEAEGWIEGKIYFDGTEWKLMDPTFAASGNQSETIMEYIGDGENYQAKYQY